jgi:hypothetical protein
LAVPRLQRPERPDHVDVSHTSSIAPAGLTDPEARADERQSGNCKTLIAGSIPADASDTDCSQNQRQTASAPSNATVQTTTATSWDLRLSVELLPRIAAR